MLKENFCELQKKKKIPSVVFLLFFLLQYFSFSFNENSLRKNIIEFLAKKKELHFGS